MNNKGAVVELLFIDAPIICQGSVRVLCFVLVLLLNTLCPSIFAVAFFNCLFGVLQQSVFSGSSSRSRGLAFCLIKSSKGMLYGIT